MYFPRDITFYQCWLWTMTYRARNRNCPPFTTVEGNSYGSAPCSKCLTKTLTRLTRALTRLTWICWPLPLLLHAIMDEADRSASSSDHRPIIPNPPFFLGIFFVLPCIESYQKVDLRTITLGVPPQEVRHCSSLIFLLSSCSHLQCFCLFIYLFFKLPV